MMHARSVYLHAHVLTVSVCVFSLSSFDQRPLIFLMDRVSRYVTESTRAFIIADSEKSLHICLHLSISIPANEKKKGTSR